MDWGWQGVGSEKQRLLRIGRKRRCLGCCKLGLWCWIPCGRCELTFYPQGGNSDLEKQEAVSALAHVLSTFALSQNNANQFSPVSWIWD
ncbi:hypothetical protein Chor_012530 [Crotalus horridus]